MQGTVVAYYLVHSLGAGADFSERDAQGASNFGVAAKSAGVKRIIYLGGLGDPAAALSAHLRSRQQTGEALREGGVPVTEFRAGVIVGSGSLSFEMIRYLTERVPVMICPRWVYTRIQPIAVRNVLDYLVEVLRAPESVGQVIEIGGADVISYGEMLTFYAEVRGLRRWLIPVPVLTPKLSSYWVHFVTPIPASIARPLIAGLRNEILVRDNRARRLFPAIQPLDYRTAVRLALKKLDALAVRARGATPSPPAKAATARHFRYTRRHDHRAPSDGRRCFARFVFRAFTGIGGARGWLYLGWAWRIRGALDRLCGGVGMRRGRRHVDEIRVGEALDFWRVEAIERDCLMRLRAEMKLPGKAWLQFEVKTQDRDPRPVLIQTAFFAPKGLLGIVYWYGSYPVHALIFRGMIKKLSELAERESGGNKTDLSRR